MYEMKITLDVSPRFEDALLRLADGMAALATGQHAAPATTPGDIQPCPCPVQDPAPEPAPYLVPAAFSSMSEQAAPVPAATATELNPVPVPESPYMTAPLATNPVTPVPAPVSAPAAAPMPAPAAAPAVAPVPVSNAPAYTMEQVCTAGAALLGSNPAKRQELNGLLARYGVNAVAALKPEQLGAFATDLRALGARI